MRKSICVVLLLISCVGGFLHSIIQVSIVYGLPLCGPNITDHFMCDIFTLVKLICTDTFVIGILVVANGGLICSVVFLLLPPMESSCTLWRTWVRKGGRKPSRPVVLTSLWLSASLFPVFSCMQGLLRSSPLANHWACFIQS